MYKDLTHQIYQILESELNGLLLQGIGAQITLFVRSLSSSRVYCVEYTHDIGSCSSEFVAISEDSGIWFVSNFICTTMSS